MKRMSHGDRVLEITLYILLGLLVLICAYPIWYVLVASISDGDYVNSGAFIIIPRGIHFKGYTYV